MTLGVNIGCGICWGGGAETLRNKAENFANYSLERHLLRNSPAIFLKVAGPNKTIHSKSALQSLGINNSGVFSLAYYVLTTTWWRHLVSCSLKEECNEKSSGGRSQLK